MGSDPNYPANGAVGIDARQAGTSAFPYAQRNQLFTHRERFVDISANAGEAMALNEVSRGAAFGDIDNDGDTDIVVTNCNGPVRLLLNEIGQKQPWISLKLQGTRTSKDATGSRVAIVVDGHPVAWRRVHSDGSYLSASDHRVHFGLGELGRPEAVIVQWAAGGREKFPAPKIRTFATIVEGDGEAIVE